jgi:hypothetical protein
MPTIFLTRMSDRQRKLADWIIGSMVNMYAAEHIPVLHMAHLEIPLNGKQIRDEWQKSPVEYLIERLDQIHAQGAELGQKTELRKDADSAQNLAIQVQRKYTAMKRRV